MLHYTRPFGRLLLWIPYGVETQHAYQACTRPWTLYTRLCMGHMERRNEYAQSRRHLETPTALHPRHCSMCSVLTRPYTCVCAHTHEHARANAHARTHAACCSSHVAPAGCTCRQARMLSTETPYKCKWQVGLIQVRVGIRSTMAHTFLLCICIGVP